MIIWMIYWEINRSIIPICLLGKMIILINWKLIHMNQWT